MASNFPGVTKLGHGFSEIPIKKKNTTWRSSTSSYFLPTSTRRGSPSEAKHRRIPFLFFSFPGSWLVRGWCVWRMAGRYEWRSRFRSGGAWWIEDRGISTKTAATLRTVEPCGLLQDFQRGGGQPAHDRRTGTCDEDCGRSRWQVACCLRASRLPKSRTGTTLGARLTRLSDPHLSVVRLHDIIKPGLHTPSPEAVGAARNTTLRSRYPVESILEAAVRAYCCGRRARSMLSELLCALGDAGAAVAPHTGAAVRVRC